MAQARAPLALCLGGKGLGVRSKPANMHTYTGRRRGWSRQGCSWPSFTIGFEHGGTARPCLRLFNGVCGALGLRLRAWGLGLRAQAINPKQRRYGPALPASLQWPVPLRLRVHLHSLDTCVCVCCVCVCV